MQHVHYFVCGKIIKRSFYLLRACYLPDIAIRDLPTFSQWIYEVHIVITAILQMMKVRLEEIRPLAQNHTAMSWQRLDLTLGNPPSTSSHHCFPSTRLAFLNWTPQVRKGEGDFLFSPSHSSPGPPSLGSWFRQSEKRHNQRKYYC